MRIFIAGIDGYLGWPLALYLAERGHIVGGGDLFLRRKWVKEMQSKSAMPIQRMSVRRDAFSDKFGTRLWFERGDFRRYNFVRRCFRAFKPDAIVHLAEMPSAPYSMQDVEHCIFTMVNNLTGTLNILYAMKEVCPEAHLVKLGTMGEYGTPNIDIPEGFFTIEYRGRQDTLPFPRQAGSWYHWTKVHDSNHLMFACKIWGLTATDIQQGPVFGTRIEAMGDDERLLTRFDYDECFGTCLNRYCAEAIVGHPLTPFGKGFQKRGFFPLEDSMQCFTLAIEKPPKKGEYRTLNQFEGIYSVTELARKIKKVGKKIGLNVDIRNLENPRKEMEDHYYNPDHQNLLELGYKPSHDTENTIKEILIDLIKYKGRILTEVLIPSIRWDGTRRKMEYIKK